MWFSLRKLLSEPIKRVFRAVDYAVVPKWEVRRWRERLANAKKLGFHPQTILDGGAFRGLWSREVAGLFPGAQIVLVEPNPYLHETIRENVSDIEPRPVILKLALGESPGATELNIWRGVEEDSGASLLSHIQGEASQAVEVQVDTIDAIAERLSFVPDLIKLDLQGGELKALRGAERALEQTEMVIVEFHCLDAYVGRPTPRDLLDYMYDRDFCLYDIVDCYNRPYDDALAGGDFFFVKNSSHLRSYQGWE